MKIKTSLFWKEIISRHGLPYKRNHRDMKDKIYCICSTGVYEFTNANITLKLTHHIRAMGI